MRWTWKRASRRATAYLSPQKRASSAARAVEPRRERQHHVLFVIHQTGRLVGKRRAWNYVRPRVTMQLRPGRHSILINWASAFTWKQIYARQECLPDAWQQCFYKGPSKEIYRKSTMCDFLSIYWLLIVTMAVLLIIGEILKIVNRHCIDSTLCRGNAQQHQRNLYVAEKYIQWNTILSLTIRGYLHSFTRGCFPKIRTYNG